MNEEDVQEELAALRRGLEQWDGLFEALQLIGEALIAAHPEPMALSRSLHRGLVSWDQRRLPLTGPPARLLAALRQCADTMAGLHDPAAMEQEQGKRETDEDAP